MRIVDGEPTVETYANLAERILSRQSRGTRLVAVDGPGGAGKSIFAARLSAALHQAPIVHTDDFATGEPGDEWWPRFEREVIKPLVDGVAARYRRYDWNERRLAEWHAVQPGPVVIIEGVSSARRVVAHALALAIWVHTPRPTRLDRGLHRDGEAARLDWERWMAEEDEHFQRDATVQRCEVIVDGSPSIAHDPEREFIRLGSGPYD